VPGDFFIPDPILPAPRRSSRLSRHPTFGQCKLARTPSNVNPPPPPAYAPESRPTKIPEKSPWRKTPSSRLPVDLPLIPWPKKLLDLSRRIDHAQLRIVDTRPRLSPQPDPAAFAARLRSSLATWLMIRFSGRPVEGIAVPFRRKRPAQSMVRTPNSMLHVSFLPPRSAWYPCPLGFEKSPTWAPHSPLPIVARAPPLLLQRLPRYSDRVVRDW